ncbi:hypothetical protein B0H10DRAFT_718527 [Mycena sp. CBHHK59/15]|nr:hypothetical protein B0H10DRAFT_718527 [Mycena sp. CBHHK59/15]
MRCTSPTSLRTSQFDEPARRRRIGRPRLASDEASAPGARDSPPPCACAPHVRTHHITRGSPSPPRGIHTFLHCITSVARPRCVKSSILAFRRGVRSGGCAPPQELALRAEGEWKRAADGFSAVTTQQALLALRPRRRAGRPTACCLHTDCDASCAAPTRFRVAGVIPRPCELVWHMCSVRDFVSDCIPGIGFCAASHPQPLLSRARPHLHFRRSQRRRCPALTPRRATPGIRGQ